MSELCTLAMLALTDNTFKVHRFSTISTSSHSSTSAPTVAVEPEARNAAGDHIPDHVRNMTLEQKMERWTQFRSQSCPLSTTGDPYQAPTPPGRSPPGSLEESNCFLTCLREIGSCIRGFLCCCRSKKLTTKAAIIVLNVPPIVSSGRPLNGDNGTEGDIIRTEEEAAMVHQAQVNIQLSSHPTHSLTVHNVAASRAAAVEQPSDEEGTEVTQIFEEPTSATSSSVKTSFILPQDGAENINNVCANPRKHTAANC